MGNIDAKLVRGGKVRVTFENAAATKKVVVIYNHDEGTNAITMDIEAEDINQCERDKHEAYMFQALAYIGSFID